MQLCTEVLPHPHSLFTDCIFFLIMPDNAFSPETVRAAQHSCTINCKWELWMLTKHGRAQAGICKRDCLADRHARKLVASVL